MKQMTKFRLTENQKKELQYILELLNSNDLESVDLAIGLLKNYPLGMRYYNHYIDHFSLSLRLILYQFEIARKNDIRQDIFKRSLKHMIHNVLYHEAYYL